jgi:hypothetical protein
MPQPAALLPGMLYWVSPAGQTILHTILAQRGVIGSTDQLAQCVGLQNRHLLNRVLRSDGLPPCNKLAAWIRVLFWAMEFEDTGASLTRQALATGRDPAVFCRTVRRVTGCDWKEVRHRGSVWILLELVARCQRPCTPASAANAS